MNVVESIHQDLENLPEHKLVEVARFVRELVPEAARRQRESLKKLHGILDEETAAVMEEALLKARALPEERSDG